MKEILSISSAQLKRIVAMKEQIEKLQSQLQAAVTDSAPAGKAAPKKRIMSLAARRKIAAAARARWAKVKGTAKAAPKKRTMSLAARRKISAAAKARWAKIKGTAKAAPKKRTMSMAARRKIAAAARARWARVRAEKKA
jgi:hypothetical protein